MEIERINTLLKMVENDPSDSFAKYALGLEYNSVKDNEKAIEIFEELKRDDPNYLAVYYQLGKVYETEGDFESAKKIFEKGIYVATSQNEFHTREELQQALEELI